MAGMLRCKDDKELEALLKGPHMKIHQAGGIRHVEQDPLVRVDARGHNKRKSNDPHLGDKKVASDIEELLAQQIQIAGLPTPEREYHFLRGRAHRLDFAWPEWTVHDMQLGLEVQGMVHRVKGRFSADLEKRALGLLQDWLILEVGGDQVRGGKAIEWLQALFKRAVGKV